jgi:hypothetical protein
VNNLPGSVSVSRAAWGVARQLAGVEVQHPVLHVPFVPFDDDNGRCAVVDASTELDRTWLVHNGKISTDFIEVLRLLVAPRWEVYGWIGLHNRVEIGVVAASDGQLAVRVVSDPDGLYLDQVEPRKLIESVVELVPRCSASSRRSITIPRDAYEAGGGGGQRDEGFMVRVSPGTTVERDAAAFRALVAGPRRGGGRFYVAARDRMGRRHRSEHPLTYLDLESGRTVFREQVNPGGQSWLVAASGTRTSIASDLGGMLNEISVSV